MPVRKRPRKTHLGAESSPEELSEGLFKSSTAFFTHGGACESRLALPVRGWQRLDYLPPRRFPG